MTPCIGTLMREFFVNMLLSGEGGNRIQHRHELLTVYNILVVIMTSEMTVTGKGLGRGRWNWIKGE